MLKVHTVKTLASYPKMVCETKVLSTIGLHVYKRIIVITTLHDKIKREKTIRKAINNFIKTTTSKNNLFDLIHAKPLLFDYLYT